mmetsp:Transcript_41571/g.54742  ORF Transcript_41571/g.54742 Transcript_41571/m.54742 type:complete len:84 (+) Transcript_41571:1009-1260(+)
MSNEERSQIVKQRWHVICDRQKAIYVALARIEEEWSRMNAIESFYKERIQTARVHAEMRPDPDYQEAFAKESEIELIDGLYRC